MLYFAEYEAEHGGIYEMLKKEQELLIARWKLEYGNHEEVGEVKKGRCALCLERGVETRNWMI